MILIGDVLEQLATLPADHFDCVVTSPPYWGLRDYGAEGQIGLEPTMAEHIEKMVQVMAEVWRVMKPSGTVWLNYGDCYAAGGNGGHSASATFHGHNARSGDRKGQRKVPTDGLKPKDLCMIPNRLAIALQEWGWWVRSEIVWAKPNPMPESVTDRPATAHEKIWLLTKQARYSYDNEAVRQNWMPGSKERAERLWNGTQWKRARVASPNDARSHGESGDAIDISVGRNLRNYEPAPAEVWNMATRPFPGAHFATFPPELVERCLMAGTSQKGCCAECGAPWRRDLERGELEPHHSQKTMPKRINEAGRAKRDMGWNSEQGFSPRVVRSTKTLGWAASCACDAATVPARVLDPFGGAGTVGLVADSLGLDWTLIEINPEYAAMAEARIKARVAGKGRVERCSDTAELF